MKVLLVGESWTTHSIHIKGVDSFTTSKYGEGHQYLVSSLAEFGHEIVHMPGQNVAADFPFEVEGIAEFDVVLLSDIGANSFHLSPQTFPLSQVVPDRLLMLRDWVLDGGALIMAGGYLSFAGIDGKAKFAGTPIAEVLPVQMHYRDDRVELPAGASGQVTDSTHPLVEGISGTWPLLLGYNQVQIKPEASLAVTIGADPLVAGIEAGKGRASVFTSDCSPHWATQDFLDWEHYGRLWDNLIRWTAKAS